MPTAQEPVSIVLLAKESGRAKSRLRLQPVVSRDVALRLAERTMRTALEAASVGAVIVVTSDRTVAQQAADRGAMMCDEGRPRGMNIAAALGRDFALRRCPHAPVAILVADLPLLRPEDLDCIIDEFRQHGFPTYVADHHGEGTTFLIHGPDARLGIAFGRHSAHMHARLGYTAAEGQLWRLRADLDTAEDMRSLTSACAGQRGSSDRPDQP